MFSAWPRDRPSTTASKSMKFITAIAALTLVAAPVQAQLNHTGRYYGPNGSYLKCTTVGSYSNNSTFCKSGAAARDEDRRLDAKNACVKRVEDAHTAKYGEAGKFDSAFYTKWVKQPELINDAAYAELRAARSTCYTANGFGA